jgi:hypothetical protein
VLRGCIDFFLRLRSLVPAGRILVVQIAEAMIPLFLFCALLVRRAFLWGEIFPNPGSGLADLTKVVVSVRAVLPNAPEFRTEDEEGVRGTQNVTLLALADMGRGGYERR